MQKIYVIFVQKNKKHTYKKFFSLSNKFFKQILCYIKKVKNTYMSKYFLNSFF